MRTDKLLPLLFLALTVFSCKAGPEATPGQPESRDLPVIQSFVIEKSVNPGLDEDVTEVTYDMWQDSWRLDPNAGIRFFRTNAEGYEPFFNWRIGIQFHYTVDGVKNSTNIVYLEVFENPNDDMPGDVDGSGNVDVDDVTMMIGRVLGDSSQPSFIDANADLNGDHSIDIDDVTIAINRVLGNN